MLRQLSYVVFNILSFDFLADHNLQDHREKYFFAKSEEIGQHQYPEQLISPPFFCYSGQNILVSKVSLLLTVEGMPNS